jgi:hypothetical protein
VPYSRDTTPAADAVQLALYRKIPYMIVGSFASMVHGDPRTTQDLDIVIDPQPAALEHLLAHIDTDAF